MVSTGQRMYKTFTGIEGAHNWNQPHTYNSGRTKTNQNTSKRILCLLTNLLGNRRLHPVPYSRRAPPFSGTVLTTSNSGVTLSRGRHLPRPMGFLCARLFQAWKRNSSGNSLWRDAFIIYLRCRSGRGGRWSSKVHRRVIPEEGRWWPWIRKLGERV